MPDRFASQTTALNSPAMHGFAITPHDSADLPEVTRAIYAGGAGAIHLLLASGADITFSGLAGGTTLPVRALRVLATGTTATALVGLV